MKNAGVDVISVCLITSFNLSQDFLAFIYTETMDCAVHAIATFGWSSMAPGVYVVSHIPARWVNQATFINTQHTLFEFIPFPLLQANFLSHFFILFFKKHLSLSTLSHNYLQRLDNVLTADQKKKSGRFCSQHCWSTTPGIVGLIHYKC